MAANFFLDVRQPGRKTLRVAVTSPLLVGRDCDGLLVADPQVSRTHAEFVPEGDQIILTDCGSTNGTTVNGRPVRNLEPLQVDDLIVMGDTEIRLVMARLAAAGDQHPGVEEDPDHGELDLDVSAPVVRADPGERIVSTVVHPSLSERRDAHLAAMSMGAADASEVSAEGELDIRHSEPVPEMVRPEYLRRTFDPQPSTDSLPPESLLDPSAEPISFDPDLSEARSAAASTPESLPPESLLGSALPLGEEEPVEEVLITGPASADVGQPEVLVDDLVDRLLAHPVELRARGADGTVTLCVIALGRRLAPETIEQGHVETIERALAEYRGRLLIRENDALLVVFPSVGRALEWSMVTSQRIAQAGTTPVMARLGIHLGFYDPRQPEQLDELIEVTAAVTKAAAGGEILTSLAVRDQALEIGGMLFGLLGSCRMPPGEDCSKLQQLTRQHSSASSQKQHWRERSAVNLISESAWTGQPGPRNPDLCS